MKYRNIALILLIISSFSYGTGIFQFVIRLGLLPLALLFSFMSTNFTLPKKIGSIESNLILTSLILLAILNYFINYITLKSIWKFTELVFLIVTSYNISLAFARANIETKILISRIFLIVNVCVIPSLVLNGVNGNLKFMELSGAFPIINANSIGSIFGVQFIYYFITRKYLKSGLVMLLTVFFLPWHKEQANQLRALMNYSI